MFPRHGNKTVLFSGYEKIYRTLSCHIFIFALASIALVGCGDSSAPAPAANEHNIKGGGRWSSSGCQHGRI
jgi:hypothetical protein